MSTSPEPVDPAVATAPAPGPVVVTGGAQGIGQAVVAAIAASGQPVVSVGRRDHDAPAGVAVRACELTNADEVAGLGQWLAGEYGLIAGVVHCAAITHEEPFLDTTMETWRDVFENNLFATVSLLHATAPLLADNGRVVLFASGTVFKGSLGYSAYVASKAAIVGLTRTLAGELGDRGITVNVISPGLTHTPMGARTAPESAQANISTRAIKRVATADDIVGPVMFLLREDSRFVTGQTISVDGGSVRR